MHHAPQVRLPASTTAYRSAALMSEERGGGSSDDGGGSGIIQAWCRGMDGEDRRWFAVGVARALSPRDGDACRWIWWFVRGSYPTSNRSSVCVPVRVRQTLTFC